MKVYTEEQVKTMLNRARIFHGHVGDNFVYILSNVEILSAEIPIELPNDQSLNDKLFHLANEFAVAGYGKTAVLLHTIHNGFDINEQGGNK